MKQDTRDLGMVATVWLVAAIVVLALGRVEVPETRSVWAGVPPAASNAGDLAQGWQDSEPGAADRVARTGFVPLIRLSGDDQRLGSRSRTAPYPAERDLWSIATASATTPGAGPATVQIAMTDMRSAATSPEPKPAETAPELGEANPRPAVARPKPPAEAKPRPKPAEAKPRPKPAEPKLKAKPQPDPKPDPRPAAPRPKPEPANSGSAQPKPDQTQERPNRNVPDA